MLTIYHNPRCRKSREALNLLESSKLNFEIIDYQKQPLTEEKLRELLTKLGLEAKDLIRKGEALWKEQYRDKNLTENDLLALMLEHPRLMERPILETETSAVIGRPIEHCIDFLNL
jgi:arsenate reductase